MYSLTAKLVINKVNTVTVLCVQKIGKSAGSHQFISSSHSSTNVYSSTELFDELVPETF